MRALITGYCALKSNEGNMNFEISFDFIVFETERLLLREFNADDVDAVYAYAGDAENTIYMDWGPANREEVRNFVQSRLAQQITEPRRIFDFAVCIKATGQLVGSMGLFFGDDGQQAELGYTINKAFWGKGYASEAAKGMLQFGFMNLNLHRISARCDSMNTASERVMQRLGMRFEGEAKSAEYVRVRARRQWRSVKHYAMLQKEFLNRMIDGEDV